MLTMLIDHIGIALAPGEQGWRIIGRLAFPIYAHCIVQGYIHTSSHRRYLIRLAALAVLSQLPYMIALGIMEVNVVGTFLVVLLVLLALDRVGGKLSKAAIVAGAATLLELIPFDYGAYALLLILVYRYMRPQRWIVAHLMLNLAFLFYKGWLIQLASIIPTIWLVSLPQLYQLAGMVKVPRWAWRSFYPVHLAALAIIKVSYDLYTK